MKNPLKTFILPFWVCLFFSIYGQSQNFAVAYLDNDLAFQNPSIPSTEQTDFIPELLPLKKSVTPVISSSVESPKINTATIFIAGAAYSGVEDDSKKDDNFTQNLIYTFKNIFNGAGKYHTAKKSVRRLLGIVSNSSYSLKYGHTPLGDDIFKNKHKRVLETYQEILDCLDADTVNPDSLNLAGSSYGSVIAAQAALRIIEVDERNISTLTLSASMIDPTSPLGVKLLEYEAQQKIGKIVWRPTPDDNVTGASGNLTIWQLVFPGSDYDWSILDRNHPHNVASGNLDRTKELADKILDECVGEGDALRTAKIDYFIANPDN